MPSAMQHPPQHGSGPGLGSTRARSVCTTEKAPAQGRKSGPRGVEPKASTALRPGSTHQEPPPHSSPEASRFYRLESCEAATLCVKHGWVLACPCGCTELHCPWGPGIQVACPQKLCPGGCSTTSF